jgi:hypothetical protein
MTTQPLTLPPEQLKALIARHSHIEMTKERLREWYADLDATLKLYGFVDWPQMDLSQQVLKL